MNELTLYELIKQKSQELGRPLKVISDWDEVIQPVNPQVWYNLAKNKSWKVISYEDNFPFSSFEKWFEHFWKKARVEHFGKEGIRTKYTTIKEVEEYRNDKDKFEEFVRKPFFEILNDSQYYKKTPFLSFAADLTKCLKEGLISELNFITASQENDNRKAIQCKQYFPQAKIFIQDQKVSKFRWEFIRDNHFEFDVFIDDNPLAVKGAKNNFPVDKLYVMPNYLINEVIEGVYRISICPAELKTNDSTQIIQESNIEQKQIQLLKNNYDRK